MDQLEAFFMEHCHLPFRKYKKFMLKNLKKHVRDKAEYQTWVQKITK